MSGITRKQLRPEPSVADIPNDVLRTMLAAGEFHDEGGVVHSLHSHLGISHTRALYDAVLTRRPTAVVEVGMAFGVSTLAILTGLDQLGGGRRLISIDPNQRSDWMNLGRYNVERAGLSHLHTVIERPDYLALPELVGDGTRVDFAYIDGWHTFDYVLLDFFYIHKMLAIDGVVGFNDCGFRSVDRVMDFVKSHRRYLELDVGLPPDYRGRNVIFSAARRILRQSHSDRYFRKLEEWEPPWNFYARF
jgi:hypothetical protein